MSATRTAIEADRPSTSRPKRIAPAAPSGAHSVLASGGEGPPRRNGRTRADAATSETRLPAIVRNPAGLPARRSGGSSAIAANAARGPPRTQRAAVIRSALQLGEVVEDVGPRTPRR